MADTTPLNISLITPAAKRALTGNRITAVRWARLLAELGHAVRVAQAWPEEGDAHAPDLLVAMHAYRSADSVAAFRDRYPQRPLVVLLAGTDIYRFQHSHPRETLASMRMADALVGLHDGVAADIPDEFARKLHIIHQSALPPPGPRRPAARHVDVCVVGHLREEKDPLRAALAARLLPARSRLRVLHLGKAYDETWAAQARAEMAGNPRYVWKGEVARRKVRQVMARCHAMVISSRMEGGANVVSEAVVAHVPVLASDIAGNRGLLGAEHPGYYPVSDTRALAALLTRLEDEPDFAPALTASERQRAHLFTRERERAAWAALIVGGLGRDPVNGSRRELDDGTGRAP